jgi:AraC-like DNA-binding protein
MSAAPAQSTFPQRMRAEGSDVHALYAQGLTWVSLDPIPGFPCGADITTRRLPGLGLQSGSVWGNRHQHTSTDAMKGNDDISLHVNISGLSVVTGRSRDVVLRDGDAILFSYAEPRMVARPGLVHHRIVRLPRSSLAPLTRNLDDALLQPIPRCTPALTLIANYVGALIDDPALERSDVQRIIADQLCELVAVTVGARREATAVNDGRGVRAARLNAIKTDIEAHLGNCDLTPAAVAKRQGISESYIRKLFESEDTSFSEFVLGRRLFQAYRLLSDRRQAERSIASIAFGVGFGDLSYFCRTFKRAYGQRPSELRGRDNRSKCP